MKSEDRGRSWRIRNAGKTKPKGFIVHPEWDKIKETLIEETYSICSEKLPKEE